MAKNKVNKSLPRKIMLIRHAEKPDVYGDKNVIYSGVGQIGNQDEESLVTLGWQRAGGLASLFDPKPPLQPVVSSLLEPPTVIYASDPFYRKKEPSQRPCQTILPLASKLGITPDIKFKGTDFDDMVMDVLTQHSASDVVLICWQHQDILARSSGAECIVDEIVKQSGASLKNLPTQPWPGNRYDMVLVFDQVDGGCYTRFSQVPQMLLAGDVDTLFK